MPTNPNMLIRRVTPAYGECRSRVRAGPLTAHVRECWVLRDNLRMSSTARGWTDKPTVHAIVIESVVVEEADQRQGHCRRFIEAVAADERFELTIVEGVCNGHLAEALLRWGWDCDPGVMDFYHWRDDQ